MQVIRTLIVMKNGFWQLAVSVTERLSIKSGILHVYIFPQNGHLSYCNVCFSIRCFKQTLLSEGGRKSHEICLRGYQRKRKAPARQHVPTGLTNCLNGLEGVCVYSRDYYLLSVPISRLSLRNQNVLLFFSLFISMGECFCYNKCNV